MTHQPHHIVISPKSYAIAVSLSGIFGVLGIHHFYLGRYVEGLIDISMAIATLYFYLDGQWILAIAIFLIDGLHTFIITIMLLTGNFKDGKGRLICYPGQRLPQTNQ